MDGFLTQNMGADVSLFLCFFWSLLGNTWNGVLQASNHQNTNIDENKFRY